MSPLLPPVLLLTVSVALGYFMGWQYLRRIHNKPVMIGVHLILGMAGFEGMAMLLRGTPDGRVIAAGTLGSAAAALLLTAVMAGLATPMIARRYPRKVGSMALATHVALGTAGFVLFLGWAIGQ